MTVVKVPELSAKPAAFDPEGRSVEFPPELRGINGAEAIHDAIRRGACVDTHRFLRLLSKMSLGPSGLGAHTEDKAKKAEEQLFAFVAWMGLLRSELGLDLWVDRAYCALVVILHRRGSTASAFKAYELLGRAGWTVPFCTLALVFELALRDANWRQAEDVFQAICRSGAHAANPPCCVVNDGTSSDVTHSAGVVVDGLPSWVSGKEGHLVALLAGHVAAMGGFAVPYPRSFQVSDGDGRSSCGFLALPGVPPELGLVLLTRVPLLLRSGLALLRAAAVTASGAASTAGSAGPTTGLLRRLSAAYGFLVRPCVHLCSLDSDGSKAGPVASALDASAVEMEDILQAARGADASAYNGLHAKDLLGRLRTQHRSEADVPTPSAGESAEGARLALGVLRALGGRRRATKEDFDDVLRAAGRRKSTRPGVVLAVFDSVTVLSAWGSEPLEAQLCSLPSKRCAGDAAGEMEDGGVSTEADAETRPSHWDEEEGPSTSATRRDDRDGEEEGEAPERQVRHDSWGEEADFHPASRRCRADSEDNHGFRPAPRHRSESNVMTSVADVAEKEGPLSALPDPHLAPDCDTFGSAIEAAFAVQDGAAVAEYLYRQCKQLMLPNPTVFSAVIFGRITAKDGKGAAEALFEMDDAGFMPHHRFLHRFLRSMGCHSEEGLEVIRRLGQGKCEARRRLFHALMEGCMDSGAESCKRALEVLAALKADGLEANADTTFALVKAIAGLPEVEQAQKECARLQHLGLLPAHPAFEPLLHECYMALQRQKSAWLFMETRRSWLRQALETVSADHLEALSRTTNEFEVGLCEFCQGSSSVCSCSLDAAIISRCSKGLRAYYSVLPTPVAGMLASQYLVWRYILVRSAEERAVLQSELDALLQESNRGKSVGEQDPHGFVLHALLSMNTLEVCESAQLRLIRILFSAASKSGTPWNAGHTALLEEHAADFLPDAISEMIHLCPESSGVSPFTSIGGHEVLVRLAINRYLARGHGGEPVKFSTAVRFIRTHNLVGALSDDELLKPVLAAYLDGFPQHAYTLCTDSPCIQQRLAGFAIRQNKRRAAGRIAERYGLPVEGQPPPAGWPDAAAFATECAACIREAEEAEGGELRAANAKRIAADDDLGCLTLPAGAAKNLHFVATAAELDDAVARFETVFEGLRLHVPREGASESESGVVEEAAVLSTAEMIAKGHCLGLDVEWRPGLERRGGMHKHRRSGLPGRLEPCSTLQVASEDCAIVFDLLSLAADGASTAQTLSTLISALFRHPAIVKLGYGLQHDLQRLASSYPNLDCFRCIRSVLDMQECFLKKEGGKCPTGLSALCARHFGKPLSKRLQTSDWGSRPLTHEQVSYAALDAHCLIGLARTLGDDSCSEVHTLQVQVSSSGQLLVQTLSIDSKARTDTEELLRTDQAIMAKGLEIRAMKQAGQPKAAWQAEVAMLLQMKAKFKELSGTEWVPNASQAASSGVTA
mmetsp:Transcript_2724/g.10636  ORF Transcript_2724/g.10636 Transcript_2724/m.10636 type:complete len:1466 (+) Transcript_2724:66-4463(+)